MRVCPSSDSRKPVMSEFERLRFENEVELFAMCPSLFHITLAVLGETRHSRERLDPICIPYVLGFMNGLDAAGRHEVKGQ